VVGHKILVALCDFDTNIALVNQIGDFINNLSLGVTISK
jgi:hypothetical protein